MKSLYIGLMSGTSMDGIDAGLFEIKNRSCVVKATSKTPYPTDLRRELQAAVRNAETCTVDDIGHLDHWVGECFMRATEQLIADSRVDKSHIRAIGSHGQTIRHQPRSTRPFTMQIGDPNLIAAGTGLTTVADFRRGDLALGGEGAPLAAAFHRWLWSKRRESRVVLNIGGIANVTILPAAGDAVTGFDTGPGNTLLDAWIEAQRNESFDDAGAWADSGRPIDALLERLLADPYFALHPPKSTGVEYFNLRWLDAAMSGLASTDRLVAEDVQATLTVLTARSVADAVRQHAPATQRLLVCGGGVHNTSLMRHLQEQLPALRIESTARVGLDPDWVEAATFAWLAQRCLNRQPGNLPSVTGAAGFAVLGGIYPAAPAD
jgi:anhydro-N-acetylmuramic acid kinase